MDQAQVNYTRGRLRSLYLHLSTLMLLASFVGGEGSAKIKRSEIMTPVRDHFSPLLFFSFALHPENFVGIVFRLVSPLFS